MAGTMINEQLTELIRETISPIQSNSEKDCKKQQDLQEQDFFSNKEGSTTKKSKKRSKHNVS